MSTPSVKKSRRPKRRIYKKGEDLYWFVIDLFDSPSKETLIKRECYRYTWQIAQMHRDAFKNPEQVRCFLKRHTFSNNVGFSSKTPEKRRRMNIYRKVISKSIQPTANHLINKTTT